jgi:LysM repeat protein
MASFTIKAGDTFSAIAASLAIPLERLRLANPGVNPDELQIGQTINLPHGQTTYNIKLGDTLSAIATTFGLSLPALLAANPGVKPESLQVDQTISLPTNGSSPAYSRVVNPLPTIKGAIPGTAGGTNGGGPKVDYAGPSTSFPDPSRWASYTALWTFNSALMKTHTPATEIALIKRAIETVARSSGVDARIILCIVMQESGGNPRVPTTDNGVRNPGLMQSHNGVEFDPRDPAGSIEQMVRDGAEGTVHGDGLLQLYQRHGNWYEAFRAYNSGSIDRSDLNNPLGATRWYVRDMANRLMGHVWDGM